MNALSTSTSSWSLATTKCDGPSDHLTASGETVVWETDQIPTCWRFNDVKRIVQSNNHDTIARLLRFRPFRDEFELAPHIKPRRDRVKYSPWNWKHYDSRELDAENIAAIAARESMSLFSRVPFEDLVRHALDLVPDSIEDFERHYEELSCRLYYYLRRHLDEVTKYHDVVENLKTEDPFIRTAIRHSYQCLSEKSYSRLHLDLNFITEPLRRVLSEPLPVEYILQQLEILAIRYKRCFCSPEVKWSQDFNVDTSFFDRICRENMRTLAVELCDTDLSYFQKLTVRGLLAEQEDRALTSLHIRWNDLSRQVEECMRVCETEKKLTKLTKELFYLRNFYSLTAVLQGLQLGDSSSPVLTKLSGFWICLTLVSPI